MTGKETRCLSFGKLIAHNLLWLSHQSTIRSIIERGTNMHPWGILGSNEMSSKLRNCIRVRIWAWQWAPQNCAELSHVDPERLCLRDICMGIWGRVRVGKDLETRPRRVLSLSNAQGLSSSYIAILSLFFFLLKDSTLEFTWEYNNTWVSSSISVICASSLSTTYGYIWFCPGIQHFYE